MPSSGALFTEFVKPRLDGTKGADAGLRAAVAEAPEGSARSHQLLAQRIETVAARRAASTSPLDVEAGSQLDVTLLAPPQVKAELVNPDGAVVDTADSGTHARADRRRPGARPLARAAALDRQRAAPGRRLRRPARRRVEPRPAARPARTPAAGCR